MFSLEGKEPARAMVIRLPIQITLGQKQITETYGFVYSYAKQPTVKFKINVVCYHGSKYSKECEMQIY
jgi:hypothetical protein